MDLPPDVEPRPCGGCAHFKPDKVQDEEKWGTCQLLGGSRTARMHIVLTPGKPSCYQDPKRLN